uniref:G-protein coupled receptors family 3 profile domain-containing protein n=1 Tax=Mucochytrium quahogii TaxID=96639 RepID=A0A7S2RGD5_9STRA|mmetsp:Transcript_10508/g.19665  ORF Transcript_10508/g.19665 Transcript_10508/m.19665 type:complete len:482 (-) Transcript_10508:1068-2513(-)
MYDAVAASCRSLCKNIGSEQNAFRGSTDSRAIYDSILGDVFNGVSGRFQLDAKTGSRSENSTLFIASAFTYAKNNATILIRNVAEWRAHQWVVSDDFPKVPPSVSFTENFNYISSSLKITSLVLASLLVLGTIFLMVWTWRKRRTRIIARAQWTLLEVFLLGIALASLSTLFIGVKDARSVSHGVKSFSCMAFYWCWPIGMSLTFGALVMKLWRIWRIFDNKSMKRIRITNKDLYKMLAAIVSVDLIILIVWSIVAPLKYERVVISRDAFGNPISSYGTCQGKNAVVYEALIVIYQGILFLTGVIICFKVRKADGEYQESKYIMISIVSQCQLYILGVPVFFVFSDEDTTAKFLVLFFVIWLTNILLILVIYVPKYIAMKTNLNHAGSFEQQSKNTQFSMETMKARPQHFYSSAVPRTGTSKLQPAQSSAIRYEKLDVGCQTSINESNFLLREDDGDQEAEEDVTTIYEDDDENNGQLLQV